VLVIAWVSLLSCIPAEAGAAGAAGMADLGPRGLLLALGGEIVPEAARLCVRLGNHGGEFALEAARRCVRLGNHCGNLFGRRVDAHVDFILENRPGCAADGWGCGGWGCAGGWALPGLGALVVALNLLLPGAGGLLRVLRVVVHRQSMQPREQRGHGLHAGVRAVFYMNVG
jgi:hypothetical protein